MAVETQLQVVQTWDKLRASAESFRFMLPIWTLHVLGVAAAPSACMRTMAHVTKASTVRRAPIWMTAVKVRQAHHHPQPTSGIFAARTGARTISRAAIQSRGVAAQRNVRRTKAGQKIVDVVNAIVCVEVIDKQAGWCHFLIACISAAQSCSELGRVF